MPRVEEHLQAAQDNRELAEALIDLPRGVAWSPVLTFYSAVHMVDAFFATSEVHPVSHVARRAQILQAASLQPILDDYRMLEALSREAWYDLRRFTPAAANALLGGELYRITSAIRALLPSPNP